MGQQLAGSFTAELVEHTETLVNAVTTLPSDHPDACPSLLTIIYPIAPSMSETDYGSAMPTSHAETQDLTMCITSASEIDASW